MTNQQLLLSALYQLSFQSKTVRLLTDEIENTIGKPLTKKEVEILLRDISQDAIQRIVENEAIKSIYVEIEKIQLDDDYTKKNPVAIEFKGKRIEGANFTDLYINFCTHLLAIDEKYWNYTTLLIMRRGVRNISKKKIKRGGIKWVKIGSNYVNMTLNNNDKAKMCCALGKLYDSDAAIKFIMKSPSPEA